MLHHNELANTPRLQSILACSRAFAAIGLCALLFSPAGRGAPRNPPRPPEPADKVACDLMDADYAVYATILKDPFVWKLPVHPVSIEGFTLAARRDEWLRESKPLGRGAKTLTKKAAADTLADFAAKSTKGCKLRWLLQKELERGSDADSNTIPRPLDEKPPKTDYWYGHISLSRVGFNAKMAEALVYTESKCGERCGSGDFFLLRKENGGWTIVDELNLWSD